MKHDITLVGILVLASLASTVEADDKKKYTLADLEALIAQKAYREAVDHLADIAPAQRNSDWLRVAADASSGFISSLSNDDLATKVLTIEEIDQRYPQVLKSPKYLGTRATVGLSAYTDCFKADHLTSVCMQHALKFVEGDPGNTTLALKMGKLVRANAFPYVAVPFFKRALGKSNATTCKDEDLQMAVIAGLGLPKDDDKAGDSRGIAATACWDQLKKPILKELKEGGSYFRENACPILKQKKALSGDAAKACAKAP